MNLLSDGSALDFVVMSNRCLFEVVCMTHAGLGPGRLELKNRSFRVPTILLTYLPVFPRICVIRLSNSATCKYCGATNLAGRSNCYKCGAWFAFDSSKESSSPPPLQKTPEDSRPLQRPAQEPPSPWKVDSYPTFDEPIVKGAHDTDRGLLLLAIGLVIGPIPLIGILGLILALIGAIFVMVGRNAFG